MAAIPRLLQAKGAQTDRELLELLVREVAELRAEVRGMNHMRQGLERGRAKAIAQAKRRAAQREELVRMLAAVDIQRGGKARGRAKRIARATHGLLSERQVRRYLSALLGVAGRPAPNAGGNIDEGEEHARPTAVTAGD